MFTFILFLGTSHDRFRRGRETGNANDLGMTLSALGRSGFFLQPLADFVLPEERMVSETELLPKVV